MDDKSKCRKIILYVWLSFVLCIAIGFGIKSYVDLQVCNNLNITHASLRDVQINEDGVSQTCYYSYAVGGKEYIAKKTIGVDEGMSTDIIVYYNREIPGEYVFTTNAFFEKAGVLGAFVLCFAIIICMILYKDEDYSDGEVSYVQ